MKFALLFRSGVLALAWLSLNSCSGTPPADDAVTTPDDSGVTPVATSEKEEAKPSSPVQDPGPAVGRQQRSFIIRRSIEEARKSMELRLWSDAARIASEVLEIDATNKDARNILLTARDALGLEKPSVEKTFSDKVQESQVASQQTRFRARRELAVGNAHIEAGRFGDAIEALRRSLLILRYSPFYQPGTDLEGQIEATMRSAEMGKVKADAYAEKARIAASQAELAEKERAMRIARDQKAKLLLEQANFDFQIGNYAKSINLIDEALAFDSTNAHAKALRKLAERARHETNLDVLRQDWKAEWTKTFDDLNSGDVTQIDVIKYDLERWAIVRERKPLQFTPDDELESPEEKAIVGKLRSTSLEHRFAEAAVEDWAQHYAKVTEVNFIVSAEVKELDTDTTTLTDFNLPPMSVERALDVIGNLTGIRWKIGNGVVHLVTPENAGGKMYLVQYEVRDLVQGVSDKPGRELKLKAPGDEEEYFEEDDEEPRPTVVDASKLTDIIRANIDPDSWDAGEANLTEQRGVLLIRHNKTVHGKISDLLSDLRQAVGIQVDIETRFLKVEDSFLEDVGIDFRGLGNQAPEGTPGRGLERNNRQNAGFDDFGRRELINPATPGAPGTGTEPGIFFDDGGDGDIMARTENLFDRTLGGEGRLQNSGGLALQYTFLDDTELEVILRAVSKQERRQEITAPRLIVYNNTRANMSVLQHTSYIRDFEVEIAQAASVANPVVDVVRDGVVLDVRPVVSADRKFITMELRPTVMTLEKPIPNFVTTLGVGQPVQIQLPRVTLQRVRTTVTMPDGGTLMLGGMKLAEKQQMNSKIPILGDLPGLSFLFSRKGNYVQNMKILILIRATIIIGQETEPKIVPDQYSELLLRGR